jgi:hypothetical protein
MALRIFPVKASAAKGSEAHILEETPMRQLRNLKDLTGYHLKARDGEIGDLKQIYFDDRHWTLRYFVVHTGNWLLGQDVLIVPDSILGLDEEKRRLLVDLSREQIQQAPPAASEKPVSRHYEQQYYSHYGWQPYWGTDAFLGTPLFPPLAPEDQIPQSPEHPHLRSSKEVARYRLHAEDDEIGYVEDFLLDDKDWRIRYLEINTRKWLPGKKVLLSPAWIRRVDWVAEEIVVDLPSSLIESAPKYDPSQVVSREYELTLYQHYGKAQTRK